MLLRIHLAIRSFILLVIDAVHAGYFKFIAPQKFRYAVCGGGNTALNIAIYFVTYNFILRKRVLHLPGFAISPHIAAFLIAFAVTFPIGFYLNLYVVFEGSYLKRRQQLFRYFVVAMICILLNYIFIKLFVEEFGWYPTPSAMATTCILIIFSYLMQQNFSFKKAKNN